GLPIVARGGSGRGGDLRAPVLAAARPGPRTPDRRARVRGGVRPVPLRRGRGGGPVGGVRGARLAVRLQRRARAGASAAPLWKPRASVVGSSEFTGSVS